MGYPEMESLKPPGSLNKLKSGETVDLHQLIKDTPRLWRGSEVGGMADGASDLSLDTGFEELNQLLPTGGWPVKSVIEIVVKEWGNGELQVLLPMMRELSQQKSYLSLVSPPYLPYAPALHNAGIALNQLVIVDSEVPTDDKWWSAEKILRHGDCGLVMIWPDRPHSGQWSRRIRRLQTAAESGNSIGIVLYRGDALNTPSSLRLGLGYCEGGIRAEILKSRFSWKQGSVVIPFQQSDEIPVDDLSTDQ